MNQKRTKEISKLCSYLLRHKPEVAHLTIDENGWVAVDQLLDNCAKYQFEFSLEELDIAVRTNNKKRFAFNDDKTKIRANQGHSIDVNVKLKPTVPPEFLYHGTAEQNLESIMQNGIKKRNRLHVHLSADIETAKNVGTRHGKPVIFKIAALTMHHDGKPFYISENGVWLTDFIEPKYISI
ncbi:MAG: RNA 2'-phosphotransferase [Bacteroidia bacterium]